jgi:hypothetical protein
MMKIKAILYVLFLLVFMPSVFAFPEGIEQGIHVNSPAQVEAIARANKSRVGIGEEFSYEVIVYLDKGLEVEIPGIERLGIFEISGSDISRTNRFGRDALRLRYLLRAYETGKKVIPALEINYSLGQARQGSVKTNEINIHIESVFERQKIESDIKPIAQPIGLKFAYTRHILLGILLFFAFVVIVFIFLKYRDFLIDKKKRASARSLVLYKQIRNDINSAKEISSLDERYFIKLSELVKEYLMLIFKIGSFRLTTEEFLSNIRINDAFFTKYAEGLSFMLRTCDLIKFAHYKPETEEYKKAISLADNIMQDILPQE